MGLISKNLVSVEWLSQNINHPDLIVLDATLKKRPNGELINQPPIYIKGAQEFNFDTQICDQLSDLPHMLPTPQEFQIAVRDLGVNQNSIVVVYDAMGIFSSPRAWWMFKIMGHQQVFVLNGGLPKWLANHLPTETVFTQKSAKGNFIASFEPQMLVTAEQIVASLEQTNMQIIDARSMARFNGEENEPRAGLRKGHIPGSSCLPFDSLLTQGEFKNISLLKPQFENLIKNDSKKIIFSCGSGVTASILALAADECGYSNLAVYDGSWSEWGAKQQLPIEV